jgi:hypothetical protein
MAQEGGELRTLFEKAVAIDARKILFNPAPPPPSSAGK